MGGLGESTSLCEHCYRHVPANVFERDGSIWIGKTCPTHGHSEYMIERDADFYKSLSYDLSQPAYRAPDGCMIEITDRCNLKCPHCYHEPDNKTTDKPIDLILSQIDSFPKDIGAVILAGAEPTLRKDLFVLLKEIRKLLDRTGKEHQHISMISNGIKFSNLEFTRTAYEAGLDYPAIGLNHHTYQGMSVHKKQIQGIKNLVKVGSPIYYVGYTLEHIDHFKDALDEIQEFGSDAIQYRIRAGSDIGRNPDEPRWFLSDHVKFVKAYVDSKGWSWEKIPGDDNIYHYMVKINGITHRLIQWCDVKSIDLNELCTGPWCDFVPGKPISNFLHQVILRDASVNKGIALWDTVPSKYQFRSRESILSNP